jgi:hypothetical protein
MMRIARYVLASLLAATAAVAQQRPIFDPDDFIDPRDHDGPVFLSRVAVGVAKSYIDDFRPLHQDAGFLHFTNSIYWSDFQFDYKHSEVRAENDNGPVRVPVCGCSTDPIYFPNAPALDATPAAPLPAPKETLQFAWYQRKGGGAAKLPIMLRYRFTWSFQPVDTVVTSFATGQIVERLSGDEQSFGFDADTHFRIRGRDLFGSLVLARTVRYGTLADRAQNEIAYIHRFPASAFGRVLVRTTMTVGGVSGRGATGINIVNPAFEAYWHHSRSEASFHFVWSPQTTRSGAGAWQTTHQLAVYVDRALYVKLFRPRGKKPPAESEEQHFNP